MKKSAIDITRGVHDQLVAIKENIEIITGRVGGAIAKTKGILTTSVGVDVAAATGTQVATTAEHSQLILRVADIEAKLNALIARLNTP